MEGGFFVLIAAWWGLSLLLLAAAIVFLVPRWRGAYSACLVTGMVLGSSLGGALYCTLMFVYGFESRLLQMAASSLVAGSVVGAFAGRRALVASVPVILPAVLAFALFGFRDLGPAVAANGLIPIAALVVGEIPFLAVRFAAVALCLASPFQYKRWLEEQRILDETRAVQRDLTGAVERSGLWLVFQEVPKVRWDTVVPNTASGSICRGTLLSREGKVDCKVGRLGIDFRLTTPIVMEVGEESAMRIVDPGSLSANGLRTDIFVNFRKLEGDEAFTSITHLGGPATGFSFDRAEAIPKQGELPTPYSGTPLGELYIRVDRARIVIFGWAQYESESKKVVWIASGGMRDPR